MVIIVVVSNLIDPPIRQIVDVALILILRIPKEALAKSSRFPEIILRNN